MEDKFPQTSVIVSNYGQGYYYSSQEMQLFLSLIKKGVIPEYAVFIDGLNDVGVRVQGKRLGYDEPWFTSEVKDLWDAKRGAITGRCWLGAQLLSLSRLFSITFL
jgi:hypothetical protein